MRPPDQARSDSERIDPRRLAFDIDGVVADTMSLFLEICRDDYRIAHLRYEDITGYELSECLGLDPQLVERIVTRILAGDHRQPLRPIDGAAEVLGRIGRQTGALLMVTARPQVGPIGEWVRRLTGLEDGALKIVATGSFEGKIDVLEAHGMTHFVEDRLDTCFTLQGAGLTPIVFRQPWNRQPHPFLEVESWRELAALIDD